MVVKSPYRLGYTMLRDDPHEKGYEWSLREAIEEVLQYLDIRDGTKGTLFSNVLEYYARDVQRQRAREAGTTGKAIDLPPINIDLVGPHRVEISNCRAKVQDNCVDFLPVDGEPYYTPSHGWMGRTRPDVRGVGESLREIAKRLRGKKETQTQVLKRFMYDIMIVDRDDHYLYMKQVYVYAYDAQEAKAFADMARKQAELEFRYRNWRDDAFGIITDETVPNEGFCSTTHRLITCACPVKD